MSDEVEKRLTILEQAMAVHLEGCAKTAEATQKDIAEMRNRMGKLADKIERDDDAHTDSVRRIYGILWKGMTAAVILAGSGAWWAADNSATTRHGIAEIKSAVTEIKQRLDRPPSAPMKFDPMRGLVPEDQ